MSRTPSPYPAKELLKRGPQLTYRGRNLDQIAFPLGGIGTGTISLGGWGQLRDWEILNRPAKGFVAPDSFFTLKVRDGEKPPPLHLVLRQVEVPGLFNLWGEPVATGEAKGKDMAVPLRNGLGVYLIQAE